jgi:hypothetical protein
MENEIATKQRKTWYINDKPKEKRKEMWFSMVPPRPSPGGQIIPRWHTAALPQLSSAAPASFTPHFHRHHLHLHRCHPSTLSPSQRPISGASRLPLFLHPPARLPATLRAAAATSFFPFQVSESRDPCRTALMLLFLVALEDWRLGDRMHWGLGIRWLY